MIVITVLTSRGIVRIQRNDSQKVLSTKFALAWTLNKCLSIALTAFVTTITSQEQCKLFHSFSLM